jgi:hypothetical protein
MPSLSQTSDYQWQNYKQLELIPDAVANPYARAFAFKFGLDFVWRSLISLLINELVDREQQIEYIERCWSHDKFGQAEHPSSSLQRLWVLMN